MQDLVNLADYLETALSAAIYERREGCASDQQERECGNPGSGPRGAAESAGAQHRPARATNGSESAETQFWTARGEAESAGTQFPQAVQAEGPQAGLAEGPQGPLPEGAAGSPARRAGEDYHGTIPGLPDVWADAPTLDECRAALRDTLEDWMRERLAGDLDLPAINGTMPLVSTSYCPWHA